MYMDMNSICKSHTVGSMRNTYVHRNKKTIYKSHTVGNMRNTYIHGNE
jgi:hypothetical protein